MLDSLGSDNGKRPWHALARLQCQSHTIFALGVSLVWLLIYNFRFWQAAIAAMWQPTAAATLFLGSLFVLVLFLQALVLMLMPGRFLLRSVVSALFVVAALSAYFCDSYGVLINREMVRNVFETDTLEVAGLVNGRLLAYLVFLGILPALLVWRVELPNPRWQHQLRERLIFFILGLAVCAPGLLAVSSSYAVFLREHKPVRYLINPGSMLVGTTSYLADAFTQPSVQALIDPGGPITRIHPPSNRPIVLFLVIGETARAANFQLGGYARGTNPRLSALDDLVYFDNATSCGTSTSVSVPCLFSHLRREHFEKGNASHYLNLLDMLVRAGVDVEWRDNNAGCKGVCERVKEVTYTKTSDANLCGRGYCLDEVMMSGLSARLENVKRDTVIVFHQIGSHGPAYWERYPPEFERFKPVCRSSELERCSRQEVVNAYDNSIAYTDYTIAKQIELLKSAERLDTVLVYVSDHGESLGEQRIYLHGMPYLLAPAVQTHVPLLVWTSQGYRQRTGLRESCLRANAHEPVSHDNIFHTVMGAFGLRNAVYRGQLDLLAGCEPASAIDSLRAYRPNGK
jgi:lipid A ethanolaminephosphotransferase